MFYLIFFILCQFQGKLTGTLLDSNARVTCVKLANPACCVLGVRCLFYVNTLFGTLGGTIKSITMPEIQNVLDVTLEELSTDQQLVLKEDVDQFQQKCLLSFSKNRSGVPFLKSHMPRVLMPGETDATAAAEKQEAYEMIRRSMEDIMAKHNTSFLNLFRKMMISVFGPGMEKMLSRMSPQGPNGETGESSVAVNG
jgi:hypothetical protein